MELKRHTDFLNETNNAIEPTVKAGDRIELIEMTQDPNPIEKGERGTVKGVDGIGNILVDWDSGRTLSLVPEVDRFKVIED